MDAKMNSGLWYKAAMRFTEKNKTFPVVPEMVVGHQWTASHHWSGNNIGFQSFLVQQFLKLIVF